MFYYVYEKATRKLVLKTNSMSEKIANRFATSEYEILISDESYDYL